MKRKPLKKLWHHSQQILQSVRRIFRQYMPSVSIPFGVLLVVFLIRQFRPFLPNLLELSDRGVASSLLTAVAGILASILGIVVAILIVALELLRRTYSRYGFSTIFRDRHLIDLVALYSVTIVVALFVAAQLSDPLTLTDATQCNFVFGLFVLSVTILFPYCKAVIIETHSEKRIKSLVAEIDMHSIYEILLDPVNEPCTKYWRPY